MLTKLKCMYSFRTIFPCFPIPLRTIFPCFPSTIRNTLCEHSFGTTRILCVLFFWYTTCLTLVFNSLARHISTMTAGFCCPGKVSLELIKMKVNLRLYIWMSWFWSTSTSSTTVNRWNSLQTPPKCLFVGEKWSTTWHLANPENPLSPSFSVQYDQTWTWAKAKFVLFQSVICPPQPTEPASHHSHKSSVCCFTLNSQMQKDYTTIYQHTGCRAFTNKVIKCKNKNQFWSTSLVIPVHQSFRMNIQKGDVSPLKNTDMQSDSGTNFHVFKWHVQSLCDNPNYAVA